jgi:hypothetical protein
MDAVHVNTVVTNPGPQHVVGNDLVVEQLNAISRSLERFANRLDNLEARISPSASAPNAGLTSLLINLDEVKEKNDVAPSHDASTVLETSGRGSALVRDASEVFFDLSVAPAPARGDGGRFRSSIDELLSLRPADAPAAAPSSFYADSIPPLIWQEDEPAMSAASRSGQPLATYAPPGGTPLVSGLSQGKMAMPTPSAPVPSFVRPMPPAAPLPLLAALWPSRHHRRRLRRHRRTRARRLARCGIVVLQRSRHRCRASTASLPLSQRREPRPGPFSAARLPWTRARWSRSARSRSTDK